MYSDTIHMVSSNLLPLDSTSPYEHGLGIIGMYVILPSPPQLLHSPCNPTQTLGVLYALLLQRVSTPLFITPLPQINVPPIS